MAARSLPVTVKSGLAYANAHGSSGRWRRSSRYVHRIRSANIYASRDGWIAATWLCGNQAYRITPVTEVPEDMTMCPTCEKKGRTRA